LYVTPQGQPETGVASWYGQEFQGNETASGEVYDLNGLTAAHLTLPFGTTIRVTNLENGKNVKLRVNDRGPHIGQRLLDVSWAAAKRLGFIHSGTTRVRVEVVSYPKSFLSPPLAKASF
jgi:rare lipoprotein A